MNELKTNEVKIEDSFEVNTMQKDGREKSLMKNAVREDITYVKELKFTYKSSDQFPSPCGIADMYADEENLGKEIDIWVPNIAHQVLCMDGEKRQFYDKILFPYTEYAYYESDAYKAFKETWKNQPEKNFAVGLLVLCYIKERGSFYQVFFNGGRLRTGNSIFNNVLSGKNYFRLITEEVKGKKYINIKASPIEAFPKPGVDSISYEKINNLFLNPVKREIAEPVTTGR